MCNMIILHQMFHCSLIFIFKKSYPTCYKDVAHYATWVATLNEELDALQINESIHMQMGVQCEI